MFVTFISLSESGVAVDGLVQAEVALARGVTSPLCTYISERTAISALAAIGASIRAFFINHWMM